MTVFKWSTPFVLGLIMGLGLPACGGPKLNVKTWYLDASQGGLIRKHENAPTEVMPFPDAVGYRCVNKADYDLIIYLAKQAGIRGIQ